MNAAVAAPQKPPRPFREAWLITMGHGLTHWYPSTFYLLLPIIGKELGLSYSQIGLIMTCQYVAGAVANVPYQVKAANELLDGKALDDALANKAADLLLEKAHIQTDNGYKLPIARALIRRALMQLKA